MESDSVQSENQKIEENPVELDEGERRDQDSVQFENQIIEENPIKLENPERCDQERPIPAENSE